MLGTVVFLLFLSVVLSRPSCRCLYGQTCWPSQSDFQQLESQLSQPLIYPVPPESACYPPSNPSGDCSTVVANTTNGNWRADQAGGMQNTNYETFVFDNGTISACYLNTTLGFPCEQGNVPIVGADARSAEDIQIAVKFASKHNLRLVVKNTGHDYLGRSTARGSFMIWTHHLKNITVHTSFTPVGGPSSETYNAITLGAGVQWHEAYDAVEAHGKMLVGGLSGEGSVGAAGGWILGGGHSTLAPRHGLGVDNVLQFTIVTSAGQHLTANANTNADLFWALRGGGGGTFGVVASVTYTTHPSVPVVASFFLANFSSPEVAKQVITEWIRIHPTLADAGWGGYSSFSNENLNFFYIAPNISWADANATINPFLHFAQKVTPTQSSTIPFDSFYAWYRTRFSSGKPFIGNIELGSRLVPRDLVEKDPAKVAETLLSIAEGTGWYLVTGGAVSKVDPDSTGLNPAWRKSVAFVVTGEVWDEGQPISVINEARNRLKANEAVLVDMAPDSGTYFNEASLYEKDFKSTFFGAHYDRLKAIKDRYDPQGLFIVAEGVGSDEWDSSLNCRR